MGSSGGEASSEVHASRSGRICVRCRRRLSHSSVVCPDDGQRTLEISCSKDPLVGQTITEGLTLLGVIGLGGAGRVYRALQHSMEREVAVKLLRNDRGGDEETKQRFYHEARSASRLTHPNVISVFDFGQTSEGELYLVMELLRGRPLRRLLDEEGALAPTRAVGLVGQICDALEAAHAQGVIHRDLKPENIYVISGAGSSGEFVKVIDFGIAKTFGPTKLEEITPTGIVLGTPYAMSPEQGMGRAVDGRSDIYAVGVMLYEMLSGLRPFERDTPMNTIVAHIRDEAPRLSTSSRGLSLGLEGVVHRAMAKNPEERPENVVTLKRLLSESLELETGSQTLSGREIAQEGVTTNLQRGTTSFIGREIEQARVEALLAAGHRLITLHGAGGMGKSRLAQEVVLSLLEGDGVIELDEAWRCDLADVWSLDTFCQVVATTLGLWLDVASDDPLSLIGEVLSERNGVLLLLDNTEQAVEVIKPALSQWLSAAPELTLIVTSRQRLRLPDERIVEVGPLGLGAATERPGQSPALALFSARAAEARPGYSLTKDEAVAAAEIVRRLDGMPLAIELAAARVAMLSPAQILDRIEQRFRLLASPTKDSTMRQATLHQAIEWSWSLLTPPEQSVLAQLSIFRGGFSVEAIESVVDVTPFDEQLWVVDVVQALRDKSLIRDMEESDVDGAARFDFYESIQAFAFDRLVESGDVETVASRHAAFFLWTCGEWSQTVREGGDVALRRRLSRELPNVEAVYHRAMESQPLTGEAVERGLLALLVAEPVFSWRGPVGVYLGWLDAGITAAEDAGVRPSLVTKAAHVRASMLTRFGRFRDAVARLNEVIDVAHEQGDLLVELDALRQLGMALATRGRGEEAIVALRHARAVAVQTANPLMICETEKTLGVAAYVLGSFSEAAAAWERALTVAREQGFTYEVAVNLHNLGDLRARLRDYEGAKAALGESTSLCEEHGFGPLGELNEFLIGCVEAVESKLPGPLSKTREARESARRVGNDWVLIQSGIYLGRAFIELDQMEEARRVIVEALEIARGEGTRPYIEELESLLEQLDS